ncbi:TPA: DNA repair protein RadC [Vibrio parahaemolyticus]|nr:DNA repair protein RadC [Vibrio parahaemolyticus]
MSKYCSNVRYQKTVNSYESRVLEKAAEIIAKQFLRGDICSSVSATKEYLSYKMGSYEREIFAVLLLDSQNRLLGYRELFHGTIDTASVYPREVVKLALRENAAALIFAHNHPSGVSEASTSDKQITSRLKEALSLIDVRVLDHVIVGENCFSFAEKGLL